MVQDGVKLKQFAAPARLTHHGLAGRSALVSNGGMATFPKTGGGPRPRPLLFLSIFYLVLLPAAAVVVQHEWEREKKRKEKEELMSRRRKLHV